MIILGIDPGLGLLGYAALEVPAIGAPIPFDAPDVGAYGVIETPKNRTTAQRLVVLEKDFLVVLEAVKPDALAIEIFLPSPRVIHNAPPVLQARGVILLAAQKAGIPIHEYEPSKIKKAVTGIGNADKSTVRDAVVERLGLKVTPRPDDAADAVAIAYTHCLYMEGGMVA